MLIRYKALAKYRANHTLKDTAEHFGISKATVYRILDEEEDREVKPRGKNGQSRAAGGGKAVDVATINRAIALSGAKNGLAKTLESVRDTLEEYGIRRAAFDCETGEVTIERSETIVLG